MNRPRELFVLTISTTDAKGHDIDLVDLLNVLEMVGLVSPLTWGLELLDCTGPEAQDFNNKVDTSPDSRLLVTGKQLLHLASAFAQVIEGVFIGYTSEEDASELLEKGWAQLRFSTSPAEIAIVAVDGVWYDVFLHSRRYGELLLQHFRNAKWEDPIRFLPSD